MFAGEISLGYYVMNKINALPSLGPCVFRTIYFDCLFWRTNKIFEKIGALEMGCDLRRCKDFSDVFGVVNNYGRLEAGSNHEWGETAIISAGRC